MPRPKKTNNYASTLEGLSIDELKMLKNETSAAIRVREREAEQAKRQENATKLRDKIRIGNKITFTQQGKGQLSAEVTGIFADKVQVVVGGRRRSVNLVRIVSVD